MVEISGIIVNTLEKISELKVPLGKVSLESEPVFLNLGNSLQEIFTGAENLAELTKETARLVDGESNDNILGNIGEFSRKSIRRLHACREDVSKVLPKVEVCSNNLKRLHDMSPVIGTIAKKLNIVALHISMETSRSKECEEMFNFFVKEIRILSDKVHNISKKIRDDSERAKSRQIADFTSITDKKDRLSSLADSAKGSVEDNINHIENLVTMALQALRLSEIHSQKISNLANEIVVALQFHDISRQQIEHIVKSLEDIRIFFDECGSQENCLNGDSSKSLAKAYTVLSLQAEQINQVKKEINNAYIKTKISFNEIGNEVDALVNEMIDLSHNTDNSDNTNPFQQLISGLLKLENIMGQGKEMAEVIDQALKESAGTAKSLGEHLTQMEDISMDLHIKAINALIMSKRLGSEGKTLSVLAEDVTEVSLDSNEFVLDVVEILKAIGGLATNMSCLSNSEVNYINDSTSEENSIGINMLTTVYDDFIKKTTYSFEQSKGLKNKIHCLESDLEFLKEMESSLTVHEKTISKIMEEIRPLLHEKHQTKKELEYLRERYTMEIERGIHNRVLKGENIQEKASNKKTEKTILPENEKENSLGDNIELF
jgi:methyl-accepting chemotaxis protein